MPSIVEEFRTYLELLRTPVGYRPENIGQFGGFLERKGDELLEMLDKVELAEMAYRIEVKNKEAQSRGFVEVLKEKDKQIEVLKNEVGRLKYQVKK